MTSKLKLDDSGWLTLGTLCKYRRKNGIVTVIINASLSLTEEWVTKGTLPTGFRPSETVYQSAINLGAGTARPAVLIAPSGAIQARLNTGASSGTYATIATLNYPI